MSTCLACNVNVHAMKRYENVLNAVNHSDFVWWNGIFQHVFSLHDQSYDNSIIKASNCGVCGILDLGLRRVMQVLRAFRDSQ